MRKIELTLLTNPKQELISITSVHTPQAKSSPVMIPECEGAGKCSPHYTAAPQGLLHTAEKEHKLWMNST